MTMTIGIIGAGAWGTALAATACRAGSAVRLLGRSPELMATVRAKRENPLYLPGIPLPEGIEATADLAEGTRADALFLVMPAQALRETLKRLKPLLWPGQPLVLCAKGIELATGLLLTEVAAEIVPGNPLAVLSGPTFAAEVARGLPTAVTLACADAELGRRLIAAIGTRSFRPYLSDDLIGAEIGGAVKNVLAIACGIVVGRKLGDNARAALITRGLAELGRLAVAKGAQRETVMGLSGLGDLTLTCSSLQSRNMSLGAALGEGRALADILAGRRAVTEGVHSAASVVDLAGRLGIDMPICAAVDAVLNHGKSVDAAIEDLLSRPFTVEEQRHLR